MLTFLDIFKILREILLYTKRKFPAIETVEEIKFRSSVSRGLAVFATPLSTQPRVRIDADLTPHETPGALSPLRGLIQS
jgi:hypothetical protein